MTTRRFPHQLVLTAGHLVSSPTPVLQQFGSGDRGGGFMIVSGSSGRHWHMIKAENDCHYGQVFLAVEVTCSSSTGSWDVQGRGQFAVKKTNLEVFANVDGSIAHENPITAVSALQYAAANGVHPNIIEVTEVLKVDENIYTIMPYCRGGELFGLISRCTSLPERNAKIIFGDVLAGMSHVHALGICHRDMSAENILLDDNGRAKIIDFGMALMAGTPRASSIPPTRPCGKRHYMAPEVAMSDQAYDGFAVGVWACGMILFIMLAGFPPFENPIPTEDYRCDIVAVKGNLKNLVRSWNLPMSDKAMDLIQSCLQYDPRRRPTIDQLLHHGWFTT